MIDEMRADVEEKDEPRRHPKRPAYQAGVPLREQCVAPGRGAFFAGL
jgi:hypothetical protein